MGFTIIGTQAFHSNYNTEQRSFENFRKNFAILTAKLLLRIHQLWWYLAGTYNTEKWDAQPITF
jgi:hypothetical protein